MSSRCCPKSEISSASASYLETYALWKRLGGLNLLELDARTADALITIDQAWGEELRDGEKTE